MLLNKGDGSFRAKQNYRTGSGPESVAIGDVNRDRKPDLVVANNDAYDEPNTVSVLLNKGGGSFRPNVITEPEKVRAQSRSAT